VRFLTTSNSVFTTTFGHCQDKGRDDLQGCAGFTVRQKKSTGLVARFVAGCIGVGCLAMRATGKG
jgi:hypothetical protein